MGMALIIPIFIPHRGCPHDCLFCNQQKISGHHRDNLDGVSVGATIEEWLPRKGDRRQVQVAFFGGSLRRACRVFLARGHERDDRGR